MISHVTSAVPFAESSAGNLAHLGRETFLKLLITQLQNQDPFEPLKGSEFVTQLAQFSELEEMQKLNAHQGNLTDLITSLNNHASMGLLNKEVEFTGDTVPWDGETPAGIRFLLPSEAADVKVVVLGTDGSRIRTLDQGSSPAGSHTVLWDGRDDLGQPVPEGTYRCAVEARSATGAYLPVELTQRGRVEGLEFRDGLPYLRVGDVWLAMSQIRAIHN